MMKKKCGRRWPAKWTPAGERDQVEHRRGSAIRKARKSSVLSTTGPMTSSQASNLGMSYAGGMLVVLSNGKSSKS